MRPRLSFPVVIVGPIANGAREHAAIITRVWDADADTANGPAIINALMFPDGGGEPQFQNQVVLYDSKQAAIDSGDTRRVAYWAANS